MTAWTGDDVRIIADIVVGSLLSSGLRLAAVTVYINSRRADFNPSHSTHEPDRSAG